jgi:hypothetical protein
MHGHMNVKFVVTKDVLTKHKAHPVLFLIYDACYKVYSNM